MGFSVIKLVIYTNNLNTVHMFNSLSSLPAYNELLKCAVNHLLSDLVTECSFGLYMCLEIRISSLIPCPVGNFISQLIMYLALPSTLSHPHISEGSWGQPKNDQISRQVQTTHSRCLDKRMFASRTWSSPWTIYRHFNLEKLRICSKFISKLCSTSSFPGWTYPRLSQFLHCLYFNLH
jgi:hypothetical protein